MFPGPAQLSIAHVERAWEQGYMCGISDTRRRWPHTRCLFTLCVVLPLTKIDHSQCSHHTMFHLVYVKST